MRIEKENYILRKWSLNDSASLATYANNIHIWNNVRDYFPHPYSQADAVTFISKVLAKPKPSTDFAIEIDGKAVGGIGIVPNEDVERITAEIGYWLGEPFWNRGIMSQVIRDVANYTFSNFAISKLYAPVFEHNKASMRALEKAGFTKEAILYKAAIKNNKVLNLHYYVLFKI
jgi:[ribosomal protein S5]-alanine N-acetyltransferase